MQFLPFINLGEFFFSLSRVVNRFRPILLLLLLVYYQLTGLLLLFFPQRGNQVNWNPPGRDRNLFPAFEVVPSCDGVSGFASINNYDRIDHYRVV